MPTPTKSQTRFPNHSAVPLGRHFSFLRLVCSFAVANAHYVANVAVQHLANAQNNVHGNFFVSPEACHCVGRHVGGSPEVGFAHFFVYKQLPKLVVANCHVCSPLVVLIAICNDACDPKATCTVAICTHVCKINILQNYFTTSKCILQYQCNKK